MAGDDSESECYNMMSELTDLWRDALSIAHYGAGCSCCGARPVTLDRGALECDVLHYLMETYTRQGRRDLLGVLEKRRGPPHVAFLTWLRQLSKDIDRAAVRRLYGDVASVLRSVSGREKP